MLKEQQGGFTLIELVVVIVILGILAATALPKFISIQSDAQAAAIQGVAGAVSSAFAVNYGVYQANSTKGVAVGGAVSTVALTAIATAIMVGGMPNGYTLTAAAANVTCGTGNSAGIAIPVTVSNSSFTAGGATNTTAAATLICTG